MKIGYDNELYIRTQSENIRKRIDQFGGKLYLEFGGKLYDDYHAARVLPGFELMVSTVSTTVPSEFLWIILVPPSPLSSSS